MSLEESLSMSISMHHLNLFQIIIAILFSKKVDVNSVRGRTKPCLTKPRFVVAHFYVSSMSTLGIRKQSCKLHNFTMRSFFLFFVHPTLTLTILTLTTTVVGGATVLKCIPGVELPKYTYNLIQLKICFYFVAKIWMRVTLIQQHCNLH